LEQTAFLLQFVVLLGSIGYNKQIISPEKKKKKKKKLTKTN